MDTTLRSASQSSATAIEHNDNLSSPQIDDKANTNLSFYSTRNEGQVGGTVSGTTTFIPAPTSSPPFPSTLFSEILTEETFGTQAISVDEHDENKVHLAYPPSNGTDASQLPPLVPVRRSQSQPNGQTQSATTSPATQNSSAPIPASSTAPQDHQVPSPNSQGWYPTAQTPQIQPPRTSGNIPAPTPRRSRESWNLDRSPSLTPQRYTPPLPPIPSMHSRMPSQPYGSRQNVVTPQPHSSGPTPQASWSTYEGTHQQFAPQPATQSYRLPGSPRPQSQPMYAGVSQPFMSRRSRSPLRVPSRQPYLSSSYSRPTAYDSIGQATNPQTFKKANAFVASDPFRVTNRKEKVNAPSDGLTFDDIPTAGSLSRPTSTRPSRSYSLPTVPTQSRYAGTVPYSYSVPIRPKPQAQSIHEDISQQPFPQPVTSQYYSTSNAPQPQIIQPIYTGTPPQFIPQPTPSQFYGNPNAPAPQAQPIHTEAPRPSQMSGSFPGASYVRPTPLYPTGYKFSSQVRRRPSFVANDPFQVSYGSYGAAVDAPSNFDDVLTARSYSPEPRFKQDTMNTPYDDGYSYGAALPPVGVYGQSHIPTQPGPYSTFNDPRSRYEPEIRHSRSRHHSYHRQPTPPTPELVQPHLPSTQPGYYSSFNEPRPWYERENRRSRSRRRSYHRQPTPPTPELSQPHLPSTRPGYYSSFNEPRPWYEPESRRSRSRHRRQPTPPTPELSQPHSPSTQPGYYSSYSEPRPWYEPEVRRSRSRYRSYHRQPTPPTPELSQLHLPSTQPGYYSSYSEPRPWYEPEIRHSRSRHRRHHRQSTSPRPEDDASKQEDIGLAQPHLPLTQPGYYSTFNEQRPRYQPEIRHSVPSYYANDPLPDVPIIILPSRRHHRHHRHHRLPTPPTPEDDPSKQEDTGLAQPPLPSIPHIQPISVSSPPEQSQVQERREEEEEPREEERRQEEEVPSAVPSIHSPIIANAPNADDTVTPPTVPVNRPSSPSRSEDMPFTRHEPHMGASQSSIISSVFDPFYHPYPASPPYLPYPAAPPYLQYPESPYLQYPQYQYPYSQYQYPYLQYQYPNLPKKSIFSGLSRFFRSSDHTHPPANPQPYTALYPQPYTQPYTVIYPSMDSEIDWHETSIDFFFKAFPKQMYLLFLLRLPSLYFSRVARIFEEADMSLPEIKKMALETASQGLTHEFEIQMAFESPSVPPAYKRLTSTWESFIDSVMREWKTFNIISVLLLSYVNFDCHHCFFKT